MKIENESITGRYLTMKIWDLYKAIASDKLTKHGRTNLDGVYLNCADMTVTNGHFLIRDRKPEEVNVSCALLKPIGKSTGHPKTLPQAVSDINGMVTTTRGSIERITDAEYPETKNVFPTDPCTFRVAFSADYLKRIADYFTENAKGDKCSVVLEFHGETGPILVKPYTKSNSNESIGVLMPQRLP